jgi:hypothetical protein
MPRLWNENQIKPHLPNKLSNWKKKKKWWLNTQKELVSEEDFCINLPIAIIETSDEEGEDKGSVSK